ncbi:hypothetical protein ACFFX0_32885 [Citricoccus parietis]|uniref:Uncharacterized protein n=1 Tax=Citricoccus parietis TaxID=592307 RepID=A0ABV5G9S2_9MICC
MLNSISMLSGKCSALLSRYLPHCFPLSHKAAKLCEVLLRHP